MLTLALGILLGMVVTAAAVYGVQAVHSRAPDRAAVVYRVGEIIEERRAGAVIDA